MKDKLKNEGIGQMKQKYKVVIVDHTRCSNWKDAITKIGIKVENDIYKPGNFISKLSDDEEYLIVLHLEGTQEHNEWFKDFTGKHCIKKVLIVSTNGNSKDKGIKEVDGFIYLLKNGKNKYVVPPSQLHNTTKAKNLVSDLACGNL
ncbi:MAG: hypothetical protein EHM85_02950 [Desulfobacteraceae bacterium]|nr:MAG: hypothetical protein EHM85_02950 [Desulfobacteraceae bacterium]